MTSLSLDKLMQFLYFFFLSMHRGYKCLAEILKTRLPPLPLLALGTFSNRIFLIIPLLNHIHSGVWTTSNFTLGWEYS